MDHSWQVSHGSGNPPAVIDDSATTTTAGTTHPDQPLYPPDTSKPTSSELIVINARSAEQIGTNDDFWRKKTFLDLADPIHKPVQDGVITFNIDAYNGPKKKPNNKNIMLSETVWIGGDLWQIKLLPKGTDAQPCPKVFVENVTLAHYERAEWTDQELVFPRFPGSKLIKSSQVAAQFSVVVYNPAEPRVHLFKNDMFQFTSDVLDRGWDSLIEIPWYSLHIRQHYQLKPLLQNDKLVIKAFIRVIDDPTRSLWSAPIVPPVVGSPLIERSIDATGVLPLPLCGSTGAVVNLLLHHKSFRCLLYTMSDTLNRLTSKHPSQSLLLDLLQLLYNMRARKVHGNDRLLFSIRCQLHKLCGPELHTTTGVDGDAFDAVQTLKALSDYLTACISFHSDTMFGPSSLKVLMNRFTKDVAHLKPVRLHIDGKSDIQTLIMTHLDGEQSPWKFFEIDRQIFDFNDRCWTKRCDPIAMNPVIRHANTTYVLHSIITHKGHLNSGQFKSYIRSTLPKPKEMWYTTSGSSGSFLSPKKIAAYEGSGARYVSPRPKVLPTIMERRDFRDNPEETAYIICYRHADSDEYGLRHVTADERDWTPPSWVSKSSEGPATATESAPAAQWTGPSEPFALKLRGSTRVPHEFDYAGAGVDDDYVDSDGGGSSDSLEQTLEHASTPSDGVPAGAQSDETMIDMDEPKSVKIQYLGQEFYEGTMLNDRYHGQGHCINLEGDEYVGRFEFGKFSQKGKLTSHSGDKYEGDFQDGMFHGTGSLYYANGDRYTGDFYQGLYNGQGIYVEKATSNIYDGHWSKGKRHGSGVTYWKVSEEEKRLCKICLDEPADQVFLDCGHICCCESCANACEEECPVCRQEIVGVHRVYLP